MAGKARSRAAQKGPVPGDLEEVVLEMLRGSPGLKGSQIKKQLPASHQLFSSDAVEVLRSLAEQGRVFRQTKGTTESFFEQEPKAVLDEAILPILSGGPVDVGGMKAQASRLGAAYASLFPAWLKDALARRAIFKHPGGRYSAEPDVSALLRPVLAALAKALQRTDAAGVARPTVANALLSALGLPALPSGIKANGSETKVEAEKRFLAALDALVVENPRQALLPVGDLRARLDLGQAEFDRIALELMRTYRVSLHHHDHPASLSENERNRFVRDERGNYYNGIAPRRGS
jgi:hypothetical protein